MYPYCLNSLTHWLRAYGPVYTQNLSAPAGGRPTDQPTSWPTTMKREDTTKTATGGLLNRSPSALGSQPPPPACRMPCFLATSLVERRREAGGGPHPSPPPLPPLPSFLLSFVVCGEGGKSPTFVLLPLLLPRRRRRRRRRRRSGSPPPPHQTRPQGKVFPYLLFLPPSSPAPLFSSVGAGKRGGTHLSRKIASKKEKTPRREENLRNRAVK